jgi:hypothetical protein
MVQPGRTRHIFTPASWHCLTLTSFLLLLLLVVLLPATGSSPASVGERGATGSDTLHKAVFGIASEAETVSARLEQGQRGALSRLQKAKLPPEQQRAELERRHELDYGFGDWHAFLTERPERPIISLVKDTRVGSIVIKNLFFDPDVANVSELRFEYKALRDRELMLQDQLGRVARERDSLLKQAGDLRQALFAAAGPRDQWRVTENDASCKAAVNVARQECAEEKRALESLLQHCRNEFSGHGGSTAINSALEATASDTRDAHLGAQLPAPADPPMLHGRGLNRDASWWQLTSQLMVGVLQFLALLLTVSLAGAIVTRYAQQATTSAVEAMGNLVFGLLGFVLFLSQLLLRGDTQHIARLASVLRFGFVQCMIAATYSLLWITQCIRLLLRESVLISAASYMHSPRPDSSLKHYVMISFLRLVASTWLAYDFYAISWDRALCTPSEEASLWRYFTWTMASATICFFSTQSERAAYANLYQSLWRAAAMRFGGAGGASGAPVSTDAEAMHGSPVLSHAVTVNDVVLLDPRGSAALARESTVKKA